MVAKNEIENMWKKYTYDVIVLLRLKKSIAYLTDVGEKEREGEFFIRSLHGGNWNMLRSAATARAYVNF